MDQFQIFGFNPLQTSRRETVKLVISIKIERVFELGGWFKKKKLPLDFKSLIFSKTKAFDVRFSRTIDKMIDLEIKKIDIWHF